MNRRRFLAIAAALFGSVPFVKARAAKGCIISPPPAKSPGPDEYHAATLWSDLKRSRPLHDLRNVAFMRRGYRVRMDHTASAMMSQTTYGWVVANENREDLGGQRIGVGSFSALNRHLLFEALPSIAIRNIPDGVVVVRGTSVDGKVMDMIVMHV